MTLLRTLRSVSAAFIGVQSKKNMEEDFTSDNTKNFIIAGIIMVLVFIGTIVFIVNLVI